MSGRVFRLSTPLSEDDVRRLRVGDVVYLSGLVFTARDMAHRRIIEVLGGGGRLPFETRGLAVYHAGPVVRRVGGSWEVLAIGPTTSYRLESLVYDFVRLTGVRMLIGKGGMGAEAEKACREFGAVYAVYTGGAAVLAALRVRRVAGVYWLEELGVPEAVWLLEVEDFGPLTIVIDSTGRNLYRELEERVRARLEALLGELERLRV